MKNKCLIVSGQSNPELAQKVAKKLETKCVLFNTEPFPNGYPRCELSEADREVNFSGKKVIIITSLKYKEKGSPIEELELIFDACSNSLETHVIITYLCGKNDIPHHPGATTTLAWICNRIKNLNPKSISWFDPHHSSHIELFHPINRARFFFLEDIVEEMKKIGINQIAAPDFGSGKRAHVVRKIIGIEKTPIIFAEKDHDHDSPESELNHHQLIGSVVGTKLLLADDMALSLSTMKKSAINLHKIAKDKKIEVYGAAAQFDPTEKAYQNLKEMLENNQMTGFYTTNSNYIPEKFKKLSGFHIIDISSKLARLVEEIVNNKLTNDLFKDI